MSKNRFKVLGDLPNDEDEDMTGSMSNLVPKSNETCVNDNPYKITVHIKDVGGVNEDSAMAVEGPQKTAWNNEGFSNLSGLPKSAKKHENSANHLQSVLRLHSFGKSRIEEGLDKTLAVNNELHNSKVRKNREILKRLIDATCFLAQQELPFRGHDETEASFNRGNYVELLKLMSLYDPILADHLDKATVFKGTSNDIQNDLINCLAEVTIHAIQEEVDKTPYIAILLDETSDINSKSQLSTVLRYVNIEENDCKIKERFMDYTDVSADRTAEGLFIHVKDVAAKNKINEKLCPNKQRKSFPVGNWRNTRKPETYHDGKGSNVLQTKCNSSPAASNEACIATSSRENHLTPANNISRSLYSTQELPTDLTPVSLTSQNNSSSPSIASNYHVYLQTATILVKNKSTDRGVEARVVFDSGATASYITESLVTKLGLKYDYSRDVNVYTFGESRPKTIPMHSTHVQLTDKTGRVYEVNVNQVPTIAGSVTHKSFVPEVIENLCRKYDLADRYLGNNSDQAYDILVGNDYYMTFMTNNNIQVNEHLYLIGSVFGFLLSGKVQCNVKDELNETTNLFVNLDRPLSHEHDLRLLWDLETLGIKENPSVTDDDLALRKFETSVAYEDNRYFVDFPWKDDHDVQSNYGLALGRLRSLVKRHKEDGILESCKTNFEEQLKLGILEHVDSNPTSNDIYCHYLPYHVVVNNERETTKIRVVMDASAKQDRNKPSLNQLLYRGPVLLENLCSLLLKFRTHKFGIIGDLEKAFLNIGLNKSERDFTRILWLKDTEKPITYDNLVVLRHTRIPFGVTSSPFLLAGVISTHLSKYDSDDMIQKLKHDIYVDNLVTGFNNESELLDFIKRSRKIFSDASLNLRAWSTNCVHEGFDSLPPEIKSSSTIQSVLGTQWNTENDTLFLKSSVKIDKEKQVTKRVLLSVLSSFYDVMGLWSPVTVQLKTLIQRAWTNNKDWDNVISEDRNLFLDIVDDLQTIPNYEITRLLGTFTQTTHLELHAFSDACMYSYGTAIYLRCVNSNNITCNLIFAKIRVSSKNMTLP
ncbi:hypothetical protein WDU94_010835 [Cyamophila willieti]